LANLHADHLADLVLVDLVLGKGGRGGKGEGGGKRKRGPAERNVHLALQRDGISGYRSWGRVSGCNTARPQRGGGVTGYCRGAWAATQTPRLLPFSRRAC